MLSSFLVAEPFASGVVIVVAEEEEGAEEARKEANLFAPALAEEDKDGLELPMAEDVEDAGPDVSTFADFGATLNENPLLPPDPKPPKPPNPPNPDLGV
jgi:hypothetical protein